MFKRLTGLLVAGCVVVVCASCADPVSGLVLHPYLETFKQTTTGTYNLFVAVAVDNSAGASKGDVYVGEYAFLSGTTDIYKLTADGESTGVTITGSETPQGSMALGSLSSSPVGGIAVDSSSSVRAGDVYVADVEHDLVDRFSESGIFECQVTGRKPISAQEEKDECNKAAGSETPNGGFTPSGVAVGGTGDVYVADVAHNVVDKFGVNGEYLGQFANAGEEHINEPASIAVSSSGDLYVVNASFDEGGSAVQYGPSGSFIGTVGPSKPYSVTVDDVSGHALYASTASKQLPFSDYDAAGALWGSFGETQSTSLGSPTVAVNDATGRIYAASHSKTKAVFVYGPEVVVPNLTTGAASGRQATTAMLAGEAAPDVEHGGGDVTSCEFEYVTQARFEAAGYADAGHVECAPKPPYGAATNVTGKPTGLMEHTVYHYRLTATDERYPGEAAVGEDKTFLTPGAATISEESALAGPTTATLRAAVDPWGYETGCVLQYVSAQQFNEAGYADAVSLPCTPEALPAGLEAHNVIADVTGLHDDTVYHYRFVATNGAGASDGADATFGTFGIESMSAALVGAEGESFTQAGGHPYELTTAFTLLTSPDPTGYAPSSGRVKDVHVQLPPGLVGNPTAAARCTRHEAEVQTCPPAAQVGTLTVTLAEENGGLGERVTKVEPLFDLMPPSGVAAEFATPPISGQATALIDARVRTGAGYGVEANSLNIATIGKVVGVQATLWGAPAEASHNKQRVCPKLAEENYTRGCAAGITVRPFLTAPVSCAGPLSVTALIDSYSAPGQYVQETVPMSAGMSGCGKLRFSPALEVTPISTSADSPTGLEVHLHLPQQENVAGVASAELKKLKLVLPQGLSVNPSAAAGLVGCSEAQIDLEGPGPAECPAASKIGSVEALSPLLDHPIKGSVYLAKQRENEFHALMAVYVAIDDPQTGIVVKVAGHVEADSVTGQLTTVAEAPQLPFEDLWLRIFGGPRAPLATPGSCGSYQTTSLLEAWSHQPAAGEEEGTPDSEPFSTFTIGSGPGGSPCGSAGFSPAFAAGTESNQAGSFSPFTMSLSRNDGEQRLGNVSITMPPGVAAILAKVPLCGEPQASEGACATASQIGHVTASAGVGGDPVSLPEAGRREDPVFLTGPYQGAPFGLAIVVHPEAGPFNLEENGHPVVVRAKVEVNPATAQVSVASSPLPTMLQGIPLDVRSVHVTIDKPHFVFNPTSCNHMSLTGSIGSIEGASTTVASRFQAAGCASLPFSPGFEVTTRAAHTRRYGAYLHVKVTSSAGQANIKSVRVELPKILPARDETLNQACSAAQFVADPAGCPAGSFVGTATAHTPVLSVPLTGPAIFVSHGGAAFPDLDIVLQGDNVTVDLEGTTNIVNKITSSNFKTVPDVPIENFELTLPQGTHSALAATANLCTTTTTKSVSHRRILTMPTTITAQNGATIKQATIIAVQGCPKNARRHAHKHNPRR